MMRRILGLGVVVGMLAVAQPANAQGVWFGGVGVGGPGLYAPGFYASGFATAGFYGGWGGWAPVRIGYPVAPPAVYVGRPIVTGVVAPAFVPRPAVRVPLERTYRRVWRRGW